MKSLTKIYFKIIGNLEESRSEQLFQTFEDLQAEGKRTSQIDDFNLAVKFLEHPEVVDKKPH